jgi:hypothetical protein
MKMITKMHKIDLEQELKPETWKLLQGLTPAQHAIMDETRGTTFEFLETRKAAIQAMRDTGDATPEESYHQISIILNEIYEIIFATIEGVKKGD